MYGEVYLDLVFGANLIVDYLLLKMLGKLLHLKSTRIRCLLGGAVGAAGACLFLFLPAETPFPAKILLHGFLGIIMIRMGYSVRSGGLLMKAILALYLAAFLCGGFWDVISRGRSRSLWTFLLFSACAYGILTFLSVGKECFLARTRNIFPVTLSYGGQVFETAGLYDTGNLLRDPDGGKPVSVIGAKAAQKLFTEEVADKLKHIQDKPGELEDVMIQELRPHFLPFSTVGQESSILVAVTIEKMYIHAPGEAIEISRPVLAVSPEPSALGKDYQMILNSQLMQ